MLPNTQAGCFSAFNLGKLFRPRGGNTSRKAAEIRGNAADEKWKLNAKETMGSVGMEASYPVTPSYSEPGCIPAPDSPPSYSPQVCQASDEKTLKLDPRIVKTIERTLDELDPQLRVLSLKILDRPELGFEEEFAHDILTAFMEDHGFNVTRHYAGLETAWRAEYTVGSGGPVLGVNSEMDALPGIGHACGHNLIAVCGLGIAIAVKAALVKHSVPGKVVLLGTPAEEGGGGKIILLERGAYDDMDVCLMSHPAPGKPNSASNVLATAAQHILVKYRGKSAHAAGAPWEGRNALDAAVIAYSAIAAMRQQMKPDLRVHTIIEGTNWAANVIPDNARLTCIVRAPSRDELVELIERVEGCFHGAASSTGCSVTIQFEPAYYDLRQNIVLGDEFSNHAANRYGMTIISPLAMGASTDFGNVSYELPSLHPAYAIPTEPDGGNHTPGFTRAVRREEAHAATMKVTKGLALTGFRALSDPVFLKEVKTAFAVDKQARMEATTPTGSQFVCN